MTVDQINLPPSNAPCTDVCNFYWDIIKDADSTSFSVNVTFHCTNSDVSGFTESEAYLGIGKFNSTTNNWVWLGGTVNVLYRNQLLI